MDEAEIRIWAANKALEEHGELNEDSERVATRLFAFAALGSFDAAYLPAARLGHPVRPIPGKNDWMKT